MHRLSGFRMDDCSLSHLTGRFRTFMSAQGRGSLDGALGWNDISRALPRPLQPELGIPEVTATVTIQSELTNVFEPTNAIQSPEPTEQYVILSLSWQRPTEQETNPLGAALAEDGQDLFRVFPLSQLELELLQATAPTIDWQEEPANSNQSSDVTAPRYRRVPQDRYPGANISSNPFQPCPTIDFSTPDCPLGISLKDAMSQQWPPEWRDEHVQLPLADKIYCRVNWPGYDLRSQSIHIQAKRPLTKDKLARKIASAVDQMLLDLTNYEQTDPSQAPWALRAYKSDNVLLAKIEH
ncbi:hypothetical protein BDW22DRAFT_378350 [Trametopsis cervina]|nr:hypothetical protein BDW22DRAFT_378350 [Trametopsis cervina]